MNSHKIIRAILYAFGAQLLSLVLSVLLSLAIPKILNVEQYGYWQLFIFYTGYVGIFHFGFIDGIYLRLGGCRYDDLNFPLLGKELRIFILSQIVIAVGMIIAGIILINDFERSLIIIMTAIYLPIVNISNYFGYIFQSVNKTQLYSFSVMTDKICALIGVVILLLFKCPSVIPYCLVYILGRIICLVYCVWNGRNLIITSCIFSRSVLKDMFENISAGIKLMISNLVSMLIIGSGRMVIDQIWGIETFGKFSTAISLINFTLQFISQVSMVLFPTLRVVNQDKLHEVFQTGQRYLGLILSFGLVLYFPIRIFMYYWLPDYYESMIYLAVLMPICIFDGKMNVLCTTYFKVIREEKKLMIINVISLLSSFVLSLIGGYIAQNMEIIVFGMVLTIIVRSVVSETVLSKIMHISISLNTWIEIILSIVFVGCASILDVKVGFFIYCLCYLTYLCVNYRSIRSAISRINTPL